MQTLSPRASNIIVDVSLVNCRGALHAIRDEYSLARAMFERALEITQTYTDELDPLGNYAILSLGQLADMLGNDAAARRWLERGLRLSQTTNNRYQEMIGERYFTLLALRTNTPAEAATHAKNGLRLAQEQSAYNEEAICTTLLGRALEESGQLDEALVQLEHARSSFAALPRPYFAIEPLAGLARVALARGDLAGALVYIEAVLIFLAAGPCTGLNEPFLVFLSCVRVLQALGDERADEVLHTFCRGPFVSIIFFCYSQLIRRLVPDRSSKSNSLPDILAVQFITKV